jgi:hypothetical protein
MAYISLTMKNLIIHPKDQTTSFLSQIYALLKNKTVIDGGVTKSELRKLIKMHDKVIMLGHGTPDGLMAVGQFPDAGFLIVDESMAELLKNKKDNIYIWCNADQFVYWNNLSGLCYGMFISEIEEAICYGFQNLDGGLIDESNNGFASIMGKYINEPIDLLYWNLMDEYGLLAKNNPIARFNLGRFRFEINESQPFDLSPELYSGIVF